MLDFTSEKKKCQKWISLKVFLTPRLSLNRFSSSHSRTYEASVPGVYIWPGKGKLKRWMIFSFPEGNHGIAETSSKLSDLKFWSPADHGLTTHEGQHFQSDTWDPRDGLTAGWGPLDRSEGCSKQSQTPPYMLW